jgi:hypothetical protein
MIKSTALALAFSTVGYLASAQTLNTRPMAMTAWCTSIDEFADHAYEYHGEPPVLTGVGYITILGDSEPQFAQGLMVITANLDSGSFSLNIGFDDGTNCTLMTGFNLEPFSLPAGTDL